MRRIGVLMGFAENDPEGQACVAAFREGLQKLGWTEGRNIRIDTRWATPATRSRCNDSRRNSSRCSPNSFFRTTPTTAALLQQTRTIPIVFANVSDPVSGGPLPRPCGL